MLAWITADQHATDAPPPCWAPPTRSGPTSAPPSPSYRHLVGHHEACERRIRDALGEAAFADAFHHGRALPYEDALAYALDESRQPAPTPS